MMILAGAMVALAASWNGSVMAYRKGRQINVITRLLQKQATEMELRFKGESLITDQELDGDFGKDYPNLSWKTEIKSLEFPDLTPILVNQEGGVDQITLTVIRQMSTQLSQAIKEMKVSVLWKSQDRIAHLQHHNLPHLIQPTRSAGSIRVSWGWPMSLRNKRFSILSMLTGFTLVEVLIAMMILATLSILTAQSHFKIY